MQRLKINYRELVHLHLPTSAPVFHIPKLDFILSFGCTFQTTQGGREEKEERYPSTEQGGYTQNVTKLLPSLAQFGVLPVSMRFLFLKHVALPASKIPSKRD